MGMLLLLVSMELMIWNLMLFSNEETFASEEFARKAFVKKL